MPFPPGHYYADGLSLIHIFAAMQKNRVNATHFAASTGYGYDDEGRDNLERVYADAFHTEAALDVYKRQVRL